jgi:hypothetical protein
MVKAKMGASKMGKVKTAKPSMGSASKRADGVAVKGKTKGKMMYGGGMAKMMAGGGVGKAKMMASGGMPMVMKGGQEVPAFAADGKGKMAAGGRARDGKSGGIIMMPSRGMGDINQNAHSQNDHPQGRSE